MNNKPKLLIFLLIIWIIAEALLTGCIPHTKGLLFQALSTKDSSGIWMLLALYGLNIFSIDFFQSIKPYIVLKCALFFRTVRTKDLVFYTLNSDDFRLHKLKKKLDNIPQRIQEDVKLSYIQRITVWVEYTISGLILVQLMWINKDLPILILSALVYAIFSVVVAFLFNPRLTKAEINTQKYEADFRAALSKNLFDISLLSTVNNFILKATRIQTEYLLFTKLQLFLVTIIPFLVLIPSLMSGSIDLGTLIAHQSTFGLIVVNAAILIQMYTQLIKGKASEQRVRQLEND